MQDICIFLNSMMQCKLVKSLLQAMQPSKGEKHRAVPPCPALPDPGLVGNAVIRQQCPPSSLPAPVFWLWDPQGPACSPYHYTSD